MFVCTAVIHNSAENGYDNLHPILIIHSSWLVLSVGGAGLCYLCINMMWRLQWEIDWRRMVLCCVVLAIRLSTAHSIQCLWDVHNATTWATSSVCRRRQLVTKLLLQCLTFVGSAWCKDVLMLCFIAFRG